MAVTPEWAEGLCAALEQFRTLQPDWNSYGAPPIRPEAIESAQALIQLLPRLQAVPTNHGGVQLEAHAGGWSLELDTTDGREWRLWLEAAEAAPPPAKED